MCSQAYGSLLVPGHTHEFNTLKFNENSHWYECSCTEKQGLEGHKGGTATETQKAVCTVCSQAYGNLLGHTHSFVVKKATSDYLKESATCKQKAKYYYSCECGVSGDTYFEYGLVENHNYQNGECIWCKEKEALYVKEGNYIYFGKYPQTIKANNVTVSSTPNSNGYYLGSDNCEYAKVEANPFGVGYKFSDNTEIIVGDVYYFKVEPIRWRILSESGNKALILCDSIIDNKAYDMDSSNYKNSEVRAWLNNEFYNKAFSSLQKELILTTTVDNGLASTGYTENSYVCENTQDKVFLLSYNDVTNSEYGFSSSKNNSSTREMLTSDFCRASYVDMETSSTFYGNGNWWLRTPDDSISSCVRYVNLGGFACGGVYVNNYTYGIVPALQIQLS